MRNATTINMADQSSCHAEFEIAVNIELRDFPHVVSLREEQKDCLKNFLAGKDVFCNPTNRFRKELDFSALSTHNKHVKRTRSRYCFDDNLSYSS